jgi:hypothetical protein
MFRAKALYHRTKYLPFREKYHVIATYILKLSEVCLKLPRQITGCKVVNVWEICENSEFHI